MKYKDILKELRKLTPAQLDTEAVVLSDDNDDKYPERPVESVFVRVDDVVYFYTVGIL